VLASRSASTSTGRPVSTSTSTVAHR
jgi:hypothetical protein